jgi:hypothetical protein
MTWELTYKCTQSCHVRVLAGWHTMIELKLVESCTWILTQHPMDSK